MHNTCTILGGYIVTRDNLEGTFTWVSPWDELLVFDANKVSTFAAPENLWGFAKFLGVSREACLSEEVEGFDLGIWVFAFDDDIVNLWTYTESGIARESPRGSGPGENVKRQLAIGDWRLALYEKLCGAGGVFDIAVATRLVELVRRETRTRRRRVRLDSVTLVEVTLLVQLFEQPPEGLNELVVVGDIWIVEVHPIAHLFG